jgi:NAD+ synthase
MKRIINNLPCRYNSISKLLCQVYNPDCADVMPIIHLYRTQVEQLAEYLNLPEYIRNKPADPDVMPVEDDKGKLLGGFQSLDHVLSDMEAGMPLEQLNQSYDPSLVQRAMLMNKYSRHMRESPYHL